jgi:hypothetical protein
MRCFVAQASALALLLSLASVHHADAIEIDAIAGHSVQVVEKDFQKALVVDGREIHVDQYISFEAAYALGGSLVLVGSSSAGGNACEATPFVLSFPGSGKPRLDGPLESCALISHRVEGDQIHFSAASVPGRDQERWQWTAEGGVLELDRVAFAPDKALGWDSLRERSMSHPSEAFANAEIASSLSALLGADFDHFQDLMAGVGGGEFKGDDFVGTSCRPHACLDEAGMIFLSSRDRRAYAAWKPEGRKIVVYPAPVKDWPDKAKVELRRWAQSWE